MPKLTKSLPKYRGHRASGQAVVTLGGHDFYLGPHGTKASHSEYDRVISEWVAAGRPSTWKPLDRSYITVTELCAKYYKFAREYYRKDGKSTGTAEGMRPALRRIRQMYGNTLVSDFGPLALKALQQQMVNQDLTRRYIKDNIDRIRRMFRWGASEQIVPVEVVQGLNTVRNLPKGRSRARETHPIQPVDDQLLDAAIGFMSPIVADMARFQRLTGCRPGEVCIVRPCDIDTSDEVWTFRPHRHKTEHHEKEKVIPIGPKAQRVLEKYLNRPSGQYCFSPQEAETMRRAARTESRSTPAKHGNGPGTNRKRNPIRVPGEKYTSNSYRRAVQRACQRASIDEWTPNQLRHTRATEIRKRYGLEAAQVVLGQSQADVTQIYAQRDFEKAKEVASQSG